MNPNKFISNLMTFFNHFENKNSIEFEKPVNSNLFFFSMHSTSNAAFNEHPSQKQN